MSLLNRYLKFFVKFFLEVFVFLALASLLFLAVPTLYSDIQCTFLVFGSLFLHVTLKTSWILFHSIFASLSLRFRSGFWSFPWKWWLHIREYIIEIVYLCSTASVWFETYMWTIHDHVLQTAHNHIFAFFKKKIN